MLKIQEQTPPLDTALRFLVKIFSLTGSLCKQTSLGKLAFHGLA